MSLIKLVAMIGGIQWNSICMHALLNPHLYSEIIILTMNESTKLQGLLPQIDSHGFAPPLDSPDR